MSVPSVMVWNSDDNWHSPECPIVVCQHIEGMRGQIYNDIWVRLEGLKRCTARIAGKRTGVIDLYLYRAAWIALQLNLHVSPNWRPVSCHSCIHAVWVERLTARGRIPREIIIRRVTGKLCRLVIRTRDAAGDPTSDDLVVRIGIPAAGLRAQSARVREVQRIILHVCVDSSSRRAFAIPRGIFLSMFSDLWSDFADVAHGLAAIFP